MNSTQSVNPIDITLFFITSKEFAFWDPSGGTILNFFSGDYSNHDLGNVQQCYYRESNDSLYVACRDTGLYQIDLTNDTTTNLNSDQCYGVTEANSKINSNKFCSCIFWKHLGF